jgi:hypothetical protein
MHLLLDVISMFTMEHHELVDEMADTFSPPILITIHFLIILVRKVVGSERRRLKGGMTIASRCSKPEKRRSNVSSFGMNHFGYYYRSLLWLDGLREIPIKIYLIICIENGWKERRAKCVKCEGCY